MLVSDRLRGLYFMMSSASYGWDFLSSLSKRMVAFGIISEMRVAIEQLEALNQKLEIEISVEDADIDFGLWFDEEPNKEIQPVFNHSSYIEEEEADSTINKIPDLFPLGKSTTFSENTTDVLKTGLRQLSSEGVLNHADICKALVSGYGTMTCLLREIQEKLTNIPDEQYENYCDDFFARDLDLAFQEAERNYIAWKDEHEWTSQQALEDKRTQEIVKLLMGGIVSHSTMPTNREINECPLIIHEEALEHDTHLPDNINIECARFAKFVIMKNCIMWLDYAKLGKYLYKHHRDMTFEEQLSLKEFQVTLDFIHRDMASLNVGLKQYLPDYEDNKMQAILDNAINIINTCKPYLNDKAPEDFLESYMNDAFSGEVRQEVQKLLGRKAIYTNICKMLGMLRSSMKVFKVGTSSEQLAACLSPLTDKPNKDSMKRKIDEGASDVKSKIRIWTDAYIKEHCLTESERLFVRLSNTR